MTLITCIGSGVFMYLEVLNDKEKIAFISLAKELALSNGIIDSFEAEMINKFLNEMSLVQPISYIEVKDAMDVIKLSKNSTKRRVFIELLSICVCNNDFDTIQKGLIQSIKNDLGLPDEFYEDALTWVNEIKTVIERGIKLVEWG